jgi:hypothetical protein
MELSPKTLSLESLKEARAEVHHVGIMYAAP